MNAAVRQGLDSAREVATPDHDLFDWRRHTLVDVLARRAAEDPDQVLYTYLEDGETQESSITAKALDRAARRIGMALEKLALPGARVVLMFDDGLDAIAGLFGCLAAGLVAVSGIHPAAPRATERLVGIARDCGATIVLGQARVLADVQRALDDTLDDLDLRWVASDRIKPADTDAWTGRPGGNEDLAIVQYTSGSTREPRGVMLSHRNVLHNLRSQITAFGTRHGDTGVTWLPFSHDMGLIGCVLMAVYGGGRCIVLSPSHFLEDPSRWLRAIARYRATLSAAPNFAYDLCARRAGGMDLSTLDLSCWAVAVNGAEPIRAEVVRRFAEAFAPAGFDPDAMHPSYGLAEATLLVTTGDRLAPVETRTFDKAGLQANLAVPVAAGSDPAKHTELVACGRRMPDQRMRIVDPTAMQPAGPGTIGEIWIAGPSVSLGYFGRQAETEALFGAQLGDDLGPYYRTGDLGFERDGTLFVTGRLRDLLIVRGKNYYPQDLEHAAEASHTAIRPGCGACFLEEDTGDLAIVVELDRGRHDEAAAVGAAIREALVRHHGVNPRRVVLVPWGTVLKTPSGKVQRSQTRAAYAEGRLAVVLDAVLAEQPRAKKPLAALDGTGVAEIEAWFVARMQEMGVDIAAYDPTLRLTDLGFDSLKIVELKADLERDLGIAIPIADLYAFEDLKGLADYLRAETAPKAAAARLPPGPSAPGRTPPRPEPVNRLAQQRQRRGPPPGLAAGASLL